MNLRETALAGVLVVETAPFVDRRGAFTRLYCERELEEIVAGKRFVQINHSRSSIVGAVRGMHYQWPPHAEMKLIRCLNGRIWDVAVDLRAGSPTFLQWHAEELTPENALMLVIPEGCAHGFQVMEADSELLYLHTEFYEPASEGGIPHDDPQIGIRWPLEAVELSERDRRHPPVTPAFSGVSL